MNDVQAKIGELEGNGWTLAAIASELGVTVNAVEKWKAGDRYPANSKAVVILLDTIAQKKRIPKRKRYAPNSRQIPEGQAKVTESQALEVPANSANLKIPPFITGGSISPSESLPMFVARKWDFRLQSHEIDGTTYYSVKDWISGLTSSSNEEAAKTWENRRRVTDATGGLFIKMLPYLASNGVRYDMAFTNDEGLYDLAMWLRVKPRRTAIRAIKDFLAKAGVFVDEARRDPEGASERLAIGRRIRALADGKSEDWIATREQGVVTRKQFVDRIYQVVQDKKSFALIIGTITNDVYRGVFETDVRGLREKLGITSKENPRDHFSRIALAYTTIAEESIRIHLNKYREHEYVPFVDMRDVVTTIAGAIGVQASTLAGALGIDLASGKNLLDTGAQGKLGDMLKNTKTKSDKQG